MRLRLPSFVVVGKGVSIDRRAVFRRKAGLIEIADGVRIFRHCKILSPVKIGEGTFLNRDVYIRPETTIGARVDVGPFARFLSDGHEIGGPERRAGRGITKPITIGDGVWIGAGAIILGGVTIGPGSIIGAGAVVTKNVPPNSVYAGAPATLVRGLE